MNKCKCKSPEFLVFDMSAFCILAALAVHEQVCVKPYDFVFQHDLRMIQRSSCASMKLQTSDLSYKGINCDVNEVQIFSY